jgi:hypothetical protein
MWSVRPAKFLAATLGFLSTSLVGCAPEGASRPQVEERDSAGVHIVEVDPEVWPPPEVWQIPDTPRVEIGVVAGDADYELFQVRGALRLDDGRIVVAEWGSRLRYYDSTGVHLQTLERDGEGPGEAQMFSHLARYRGDSLALVTVRSSAHSEFLILDQEARPGRNLRLFWHERTTPASDSTRTVFRIGGFPTSLSDGSFVVEESQLLYLGGSPGDAIPWKAPLTHLGPEGMFLDTIAFLQIGEYEYQPLERGDFENYLNPSYALPARAHGQSIYWTRGKKFEVDVFEAPPLESGALPPSPSAPLAHSFRIQVAPPPLTESWREEYIETIADLYYRPESRDPEKDRAEGIARRRSLPTLPNLPAISDLRVDTQGNIWLQLFHMLRRESQTRARQNAHSIGAEAGRWIVLDHQGRLLGSVLTPVDLEITDIGDDYLLGWQADQYGVQHVRLYRLEKG